MPVLVKIWLGFLYSSDQLNSARLLRSFLGLIAAASLVVRQSLDFGLHNGEVQLHVNAAVFTHKAFLWISQILENFNKKLRFFLNLKLDLLNHQEPPFTRFLKGLQGLLPSFANVFRRISIGEAERTEKSNFKILRGEWAFQLSSGFIRNIRYFSLELI